MGAKMHAQWAKYILLFSLDQRFSKWAERSRGGDFEGQWGETNIGGNGRGKQHKGVKTLNH